MDIDTLGQMRLALQGDLTVDSTATFYNETLIDRSINRAYRKAGGLVLWPELEDSKKTGTVATWEYYDYPPTWYPDSVWKLVIDDVDYEEPLSFKDYLYEKENWTETEFERIWSSQWRRLFVYPIPTVTGDNNMIVWGQKAVSVLTLSTDITIFSYSMPECNEAIVLEAKAILKGKTDETNSSSFMSNEAKQILLMAFNRIKKSNFKYKRTAPMLNVPDFFK